MGTNTRPLLCVPRSLKCVVPLGQASLLLSQLLGEMVGLSIMPNVLYVYVDVPQTNMTHFEYYVLSSLLRRVLTDIVASICYRNHLLLRNTYLLTHSMEQSRS